MLVLTLNALAAATLLVAAPGKLVAPRPLRRALHELTSRAVPVAVVRGFAVVEVVVAFGVLLPSARLVAALGLGVLGGLFVAAGLAGRVRRSSVPCGCLGGGEHPLGPRSVLAGVLFLAVAGLNLTAAPPAAGLRPAAPLAAAAATVLLCLWTHRALAWRLLRPRPSAAGSPAPVTATR